MSNEVYQKVAEVLNTLPNGFPPTESGVEIKLLKKVFEPDEAELFCKLKLNYETAEQIARRSAIPAEGLSEKLESMWGRGQIESREEGGKRVFRLAPWVVGIYRCYELIDPFNHLRTVCRSRFAEEKFEIEGRPSSTPSSRVDGIDGSP
ncbi:MAG: hypothetical protein HY882_12115 [Deltaproteobacteria bacterium]|nr:hypothetical protein [Deltaproteobacteria bacterium]